MALFSKHPAKKVGRRPSPPPPSPPPTHIGQILLFRMDKDGRDAPLLVLNWLSPTSVSGILFVDSVRDADTEYVKRHFFVKPTTEMPYRYLAKVMGGRGVGHWRLP